MSSRRSPEAPPRARSDSVSASVHRPPKASVRRKYGGIRHGIAVFTSTLLLLSIASLTRRHWTERSASITLLPERYMICSPAEHWYNRYISTAAASNGSIYTGDEQRFAAQDGFTQCVGVDNGIITHVGQEHDAVSSFCGQIDEATRPLRPAAQRRRGPHSNKAARLGRHAKHSNRDGSLKQSAKCPIHRLRPDQTLFPGFHDAHGHILDYGWSRNAANLVGSTSVNDVIQRLEEYVRSRPHLFGLSNEAEVAANASAAAPWIEGLGWDQTKWSPATFPTAANLSRSPLLRRFPIMLRRVDVHAIWLNEKALEMVVHGAKGFPLTPKEDRNVEGGLVVRDNDGNPTGILIDNAMNFAYQVVPEWTDELRRMFLDRAAEDLIRVGITAVGDAATDLKAAAFYTETDAQGGLRFRIYSMLACPPGERRCAHRIEQVLSRPSQGATPAEGAQARGKRFTLRAVKLFNDGALGSWGSAMWEDYADKPGERGLLLIPEDELPSLVEYWLKRGWQVCTHAIGDRANTLTLDAYEAYLAAHPEVAADSLRPRIEHAQLMRPSDLTRFAQLGVIASMQPTHCTSDMGYVEKRIGPTRASHGAYAWKSLLDANASLALGSDFPVELPDPLHGIYSAITRLNAQGNSPHGPGGWYPHERLSRREAVRGFTRDPAFAQFEEDVAGSIAVGKRADFTLLDRNILDEEHVTPLMVRNAQVDATIIDGKVAFDRLAELSAAARRRDSFISWLTDIPENCFQSFLSGLALRLARFEWTILLGTAVFLGALWLLLTSNKREPYQTLSCLALNVRAPTTAWMNMGFWTPQLAKRDLDFPLACQTLAEQLYAAAGLKPGLRVLDVGCGAGQSTLLLLNKYAPEVLHAVTSLADEAAFAAERLQQQLQERSKGGDRSDVKVWASDVLDWLRSGEGDGVQYDVILALDCAFHFSDRAEYIRLATRRLKRGGRLAFVDLLSAYPAPKAESAASVELGSPPFPRQPPSLRKKTKHAFTCMLASVNPANLWSVDRYVSELETQGNVKAARISMRDITADVFPGFARFLRAFATEDTAWRGGGWAMRKGLGAFSNVVEGWSQEGGLVRCFIVVAQEGEAPPETDRSGSTAIG